MTKGSDKVSGKGGLPGSDEPVAKAPIPGRLVDIVLDETSIARSTPDVEHERAVAIYDLIEGNEFQPCGHVGGAYKLKIAVVEGRLVFDIMTATAEPVVVHMLSLTPFRKVLRDYFMVCESYYSAIRTSTPSQIESIDMGRRGLHNEGSQILIDRLADKITIDFDTGRRLFTLICALHWKG
jgi:uncharacterized protein (UPF0262 family)